VPKLDRRAMNSGAVRDLSISETEGAALVDR
jgi:hypothetical protein